MCCQVGATLQGVQNRDEHGLEAWHVGCASSRSCSTFPPQRPVASGQAATGPDPILEGMGIATGSRRNRHRTLTRNRKNRAMSVASRS